MTVALHIPADQPRRWHGQLAAALAVAGETCFIRRVAVAGGAALPRALDAVLLLDRTLHGAGPHALDRAEVVATGGAEAAPDFTIDLTGRANCNGGDGAWVPLFDGAPGEAALWTALLDGRAPRLDLFHPATGGLVPIGLPAIEAPHQVMVAADHVLARLVPGIVRAVRLGLLVPGVGAGACLPTPVAVAQSRCLIAAASILAGKAERALARRLGSAPQWQVALRPDTGAPVPAGPLDLNGWTLIPDDGQRYYADPFPIAHEGRRSLFVEEYPYASGRGIISVMDVDAHGRALSAPRPVLEAPFHLSYPQVFEEGGAVYMLPEAAASGRLTLYRAQRFPDDWEPVCDLLDVRVHDATLLKTADGWWLFATTDDDGASSWDALSLFHAPGLMGPWMAHDLNPVVVDASAARPAGAVFPRDGALWRPVQDCRAGYGAALGFQRIDRLDRGGFAQTHMSRVLPPARRGFAGVHTWNQGAGLAVIDVFGPRTVGPARV